ncbi:MAG: NUDIX hydrolase [Bacillaceae bacterium]
MEKWYGAAAVCLNEFGKLLMVLQPGESKEHQVWSIPSGEREGNETFEQCCIREVMEETGYEVEAVKEIWVKEDVTYGVPVEVHYFEVKQIRNVPRIESNDEDIFEVAWRCVSDFNQLTFSFPRDKDFLTQFIEKRVKEEAENAG